MKFTSSFSNCSVLYDPPTYFGRDERWDYFDILKLNESHLMIQQRITIFLVVDYGILGNQSMLNQQRI